LRKESLMLIYFSLTYRFFARKKDKAKRLKVLS